MNQYLDKIIAFHKANRIGSHLIFWCVITLMSSLESYLLVNPYEFSFAKIFILDLVASSSKIITAYFTIYYVLPIFADKKKYLLSILAYIIGCFSIYAVVAWLKMQIYPTLGIDVFFPQTPIDILDPAIFFRYYFFPNTGRTAGILLIKLLINHLNNQKHTLALEKEKAELELKLLKTQLNPHFLFNTLNNIYSLSLYQSPMTSGAIARLAEILDHILYRCNGVTVPLSNEIKLLENYIALEKLRYDDTLKVYFKTEIEEEIEIAPLILVSLVENAFKHGAGEVVGFPFISIDLKVKKQVFYFQIENTYTTDNEEDTREKIGLQNLRQQLNLIYPNQYQLEVTQRKNLFKVSLKIVL